MFVVLLPSTTDNQTVFWPLDKKVFVTGPSERLEQKTNRNIFHHWHKWLSQTESSSLSLSGFVRGSPEFNPSITSWNSQLVGILNSLLSISNICLFIQCPHLTLTSVASDRQTDRQTVTYHQTTDWLIKLYTGQMDRTDKQTDRETKTQTDWHTNNWLTDQQLQMDRSTN